ncbi:hypothetical protein LFM09_49740 [Lentzea alba]|uniref:hypothetical protein n=1 Tax=Lentzea alba TaxID=2714351 RepID=UPI0039BF2DE5
MTSSSRGIVDTGAAADLGATLVLEGYARAAALDELRAACFGSDDDLDVRALAAGLGVCKYYQLMIIERTTATNWAVHGWALAAASTAVRSDIHPRLVTGREDGREREHRRPPQLPVHGGIPAGR